MGIATKLKQFRQKRHISSMEKKATKKIAKLEEKEAFKSEKKRLEKSRATKGLAKARAAGKRRARGVVGRFTSEREGLAASLKFGFANQVPSGKRKVKRKGRIIYIKRRRKKSQPGILRNI